MHIQKRLDGSFAALVFSLILSVGLAGCGGGGGSSSTPGNGGTTPTVPTTPTTYTVSTTAADGVSFSPSSASVESGKTASFTVTLAAGYKNLKVSGCGVSLSVPDPGTQSFTTNAIQANCTISSTADKVIAATKSLITAVTYDRSAMYRDEIGTTPVIIEVAAQLVTGHKLVLDYSGRDKATNAVVTRQVQLLDDGAGSDKKAGDGLYTAQVKYDLLPRYEYMGIADYEGHIHVLDQNGAEVSDAGVVKAEMSLVVVDRAKAPTITKVADDVYASSSVVNVVLPLGASNEADAKSTFKRALNFWPDVFDEAAFFYGGQIGPNVSSEYSYTVKNDVQGIGIPAMDKSSEWGSTTLQHVQQIDGGTSGPFMHEFTHRFGFMLNDPRLHLSEYTSCACHFDAYNQINWDPISVNGGVGIVQQASGDWVMQSLGGIPRYGYSDMMLYLMGLLDPGELAPQPWVLDQSWRLPQGQTIPAAQVKLVTVADIEAVYGKRSPAYGTAPTSFHVLTVLITHGRPALAEEMAAVQTQMDYYSATGAVQLADGDGAWRTVLPFRAATKDRGMLVTALPARK